MLDVARLLPSVNAALNGTSAILLIVGFALIRQRRVGGHRACMIAAFGTSTLFLASYLMLRFLAGMTRYTAGGWLRSVYFAILGTHTLLAACTVPMALITLVFALRGRFSRHGRIARWTLPIWLYVSVTGVVVYLLLYHV